MPAPGKQVRVFISSTFRDMHAERDHLVTVVFPELRERVEQLGLEFFDVDLRWGVPTKDLNGETANSWEYCRQWIDRVEPFFVCILGQRYGWVPEPRHFRDAADRQRQEREPRSITDLEVRHAVLDTRRKLRSYFYLRATPVPESNAEYVDPPEYRDRLEQLKTAVRQCGRPVHDYHPEWIGERFTGMEEFGRFVLEGLWSGVLRDERYVSKKVWRQVLEADPDTDPRYTNESQPVPRELWGKIVAFARPAPVSPLDVERQQMEAFAASRLRWFQGRTHELQQLTEFIQSTSADAPRLAVVAAVPGQGKSALLAKLSTLITQPATFLITHFIGASPNSAGLREMLRRLCQEVYQQCGLEEQKQCKLAAIVDQPGASGEQGETNRKLRENVEKEFEIRQDNRELANQFRDFLAKVPSDRRIVILLDALNELTDGHDLHWLPDRLSPSVRVVVSCVEDAAAKVDSPEARVLNALASRQPAPLRVRLGPLTEPDVRTIVVEYLKEYCKELDREHVDAICHMEQARNPLYLLVMLGELRTLGGNDMNRIVGERIAALVHDYPDTVSLFRWALQRLEVFGAEAVRWWCLYLVHGRVGMTSHELADLLARKLGTNAAPTALLIERGLRRYLLRRGGQLDFFHSQLRQAVMGQYGPRIEAAAIHREIAEYFHAQDYFLESVQEQRARAKRLPPTPRPANSRKVTELPWQLLAAAELSGEWGAVEELLSDLFFLEAKAEAGFAFDLLGDFRQLLLLLPKERPQRQFLRLLAEALRRNIHFIARRPTALFQALWNTAWWYDHPETARHFDSKSGPWVAHGERVSDALERWRAKKEKVTPGFAWVRSLRPPKTILGGPLEAVLASDGGALTCVAITADGGRVAAGAQDGLIQAWEMDSCLMLPSCDYAERMDRVFLANRPTLTGGDWDDWDAFKEFFERIDAASGGEFRKQQARTREIMGLTVECVAFFRDGARLASGTRDATVRIWNTSSGEEIQCLRGHTDTVKKVAVSPTADCIASIALCDSGVFLWEISGANHVHRVIGGHHLASSICFSPDGKYLAAGGRDGTIRIWNTDRETECGVLVGPQEPVEAITFDLEGRRVLAGSAQGRLSIWDFETRRLVKSFQAHAGAITAVACCAGGTLVVTGSWDGRIRLWHANSFEPRGGLLGHSGAVLGIAAVTGGQRLASVAQLGGVRVWSVEDGAQAVLEGRLRGHGAVITGIAVADHGKVVVSSGKDGTIREWATDTGVECAPPVENESPVEQLVVTPDGTKLVFRLSTAQTVTWDRLHRRRLAEIPKPTSPPRELAVSPDNRLVASGGTDGTLYLWDLVTGSEWVRIQKTDSPVFSLAFFPNDSHRIAIGWMDGGLAVYNIATRSWDEMEPHHKANGRSVEELLASDPDAFGYAGAIAALAVSPKGDRVASGDYHNWVRFWDARIGCETARGEHKSTVFRIAFSPDGSRAASWSRDGEVRVWDVRKGRCIDSFPGFADLAATAASQYPCRAVQWAEETVFQKQVDRSVLTWFEQSVYDLRLLQDGTCCTGSDRDSYLYLFKLEGSLPLSPSPKDHP